MSIPDDAALVSSLSLAMTTEFFATNDRLIRSLTVQMRQNEAEKWLIRAKVLALLNGDFAPSASALNAALIVSQREIIDWLMDQYGANWQTIGTEGEAS